MGSTSFRSHRVFKSDISVEDGALFGGGTVIVASKCCENNVYPRSYSWNIEFIGSEDVFVKRYLPETAYFFDDGLSQASYASNGKEFQEHLRRLYNSAGKLSLKSLHDMGFYGYSWPQSGIEKLGLSHGLKKYSYYLGTRFGKMLETVSDIERMIREAYAIAPSNGKNIWLGSLWRLDFEKANILNQAEDGARFNIF